MSSVVLVLFALVCGAVIFYFLGMLLGGDMRNRGQRSLFSLGVTVLLWIVLATISEIAAAEYYPPIYMLRTAMACCVPYMSTRFFLIFAESKIGRNRWLRRLMTTALVLDILALMTNPWHRLYFDAIVYPRSPVGPLFIVHSVLSYIVILLGLSVLLPYIVNNARRNPSLLLCGASALVPFVYNIGYTLGAFGDGYNLSAYAFFFTFVAFAWIAFKGQLFDIRRVAFSRLFSDMKEPIVIINAQGVVVDFNPAWRNTFPEFEIESGHTTQRELDRYMQSLIPKREPSGDPEAAARPAAVAGEITVRRGEGLRTFRVDNVPTYKKNARSGFMVTLSDISEYRAMIDEINLKNRRLVELKEEAEQASLAKGAFLANMSHEMRTPMGAIIGMTAIAKSAESVQKKDECIKKIEDASVHLLGVINDVLDMSKIESGKLELVYAPLELEPLLMHAVNFIQYSVQQKEQQLLLDIDMGLPRQIVGDDQRIAQVLTNLLSNAVKFTPKGGSITLRVQVLEDDEDECLLQFAVQDTGIGIDPERQQQLFVPFEQADSGISRKFGGTGLGLAISKQIVEMAGGRISLMSQPGQGSTFFFTLPAKKAEAAPCSAIDWQALRVMLVAGDETAHQFFARLAATHDFTVTAFHEVGGALEYAQMAEEQHIVFLADDLPDQGCDRLVEQLSGKHELVVMLPPMAQERALQVPGGTTVRHIPTPLFLSVVEQAIADCLEVDSLGSEAASDEAIFAGKRVLLAEDVEINREIVMALLEHTGVELTCAENGRQAVEIFERTPQDFQAVPIIAMTANVFREDIERCLENGMNDHVGKPVDQDKLIQALTRHLVG